MLTLVVFDRFGTVLDTIPFNTNLGEGQRLSCLVRKSEMEIGPLRDEVGALAIIDELETTRYYAQSFDSPESITLMAPNISILNNLVTPKAIELEAFDAVYALQGGPGSTLDDFVWGPSTSPVPNLNVQC